MPHVLAWHEVDRAVTKVLVDRGYDAERLSKGEPEFDLILGALLLKTDIWQLKQLSALPEVLQGLGLNSSAIALCYALGYEEDFPEGWVSEGESLYDFFAELRDQVPRDELPNELSLSERRTVTLNSRVLGCRITAEIENAPPCVELAESVLAALESLLSTATMEQMVAREPVLTIKVRKSELAGKPFEFSLQDRSGRPHVDVWCSPFNPHSLPPEAQSQVKSKLVGLLTQILARVFVLGDPEQELTKLVRHELALERSVNFTGSFVTLGNVLGHAPKTDMSAWCLPGAREYALKRSEEWDAADRRANLKPGAEGERREPSWGEGEPPDELQELGQTKHTQIETVSFIREALWEQAGWSGTAFLWDADNSVPPVIAPTFGDAEAAKQIFAGWRKDLGERDAGERLRLSIIRGISRANPHAYRVVIGSNLGVGSPWPKIRYWVMLARVNTMEPASPVNLERFLSNYQAVGEYYLAHAVLRQGSSAVRPITENCLIKRELNVREAWQIGRHDPDIAGILEDDDPIIPEGQDDAPVLKLLRWKRLQGAS